MIGIVSWPDDAITALAILIFIVVIIWWRHRFPKRYDFTLHLKLGRDDLNRDAKKPPPDPRHRSDEGS